MIVGRRPMRSAANAPSTQPTGAAKEIIKVYEKDLVNVRPWRMKKVGNQVTKPKIRVLTTMSPIEPTTSRGSSVGPNRSSRLRAGVMAVVSCGRDGRSWFADSLSIFVISSSASAKRSLDSSQRGDSGIDFRRYQTMRAPIPAIKKTGRQPNVGMIIEPRSAVAGSPDTTTNDMKASHRPRELGGTNSARVE